MKIEDCKNEPCLLKQVEQQEIEAEKFGFYWESFDQLMEQIQSECLEIHEAWHHQELIHLQEEIGDLIQAAISLAIFCKLDPQETLRKSIKKFQLRFNTVVKMAQQDGHDSLHQQPLEVLMDYWNRAKQEENSFNNKQGQDFQDVQDKGPVDSK